ncbi:hypothetical protein ABU550_004383, partial [Yersinia enterocolitica]
GTLPGLGRADIYLGLACGSESDTSFGACPTMLTHWAEGGANVTLRFTNLKTKATVDLTVTGNMGSCESLTGFTGAVTACRSLSGIVGFEAKLPETELRKLPYGGVWVAQMRLKTMGWKDKPLGDVVTD